MTLEEIKEQITFMGEDWFFYKNAKELIKQIEKQQEEIEQLKRDKGFLSKLANA